MFCHGKNDLFAIESAADIMHCPKKKKTHIDEKMLL